MRITHALVQVTLTLMADPDTRHWGYDLRKRSGVRSGVLYPMLARLLTDGLLADGREDPATIQGSRPPRRYYELTDKGRTVLGGVISKARTDRRFTGLFTGA